MERIFPKFVSGIGAMLECDSVTLYNRSYGRYILHNCWFDSAHYVSFEIHIRTLHTQGIPRDSRNSPLLITQIAHTHAQSCIRYCLFRFVYCFNPCNNVRTEVGGGVIKYYRRIGHKYFSAEKSRDPASHQSRFLWSQLTKFYLGVPNVKRK